jgi:acetyl esterase/lipase
MAHAPSVPRSGQGARLRVLLAALALLGVPACRWNVADFGRPSRADAEKACAVELIRDVVYYTGPGASANRHRLDLFLPRGQQGYPVVVLVHGGAWMLGDHRCWGLYSAVGAFLASQGIGAVLPDYRQSPTVRHPEHIKDVARAFAWAHDHVADHGGRPDRLFLVGHSAGGHLVALLATDERFLKAEGLSSADVRGVVAVSGVYHIPPGPMALALGGSTPLAFRLDEVLPLRGVGTGVWPQLPHLPGIPLSLNVYGPAFGDDAQARADASPVNHVRPGLPPFLLFCAERDLPSLPGMAEEFHRALLARGCPAQLYTAQRRNHSSIFFRATEPDDPVARRMVEFIRRHTEEVARPTSAAGPPAALPF